MEQSFVANADVLRFEQLARMALALLLVLVCWFVLRPFLSAILFAVAISVSTWPAYVWLLRRLGGQRTVASLLACVVVALAVIVPTAMLVISLGDAALWLLKLIEEWRTSGPPEPPAWLGHIPLLGEPLRAWLRGLGAGGDRIAELAGHFVDPARRLALLGGRALGLGLGQALFSALLLFFLYRDGAALAAALQAFAVRIAAERGRALLEIAQRTVTGVMFSVIGTALAQAMVATIGFAIAGVPNPFLLGALTFVLSMAPVGPPLIWGAAAFWLFRQGEPGWALFMIVYGFFGISSVDNVIKPFLISRSSHLPFALTFMGVIGGMLAFGVAGVFIGPTVLALALHLGRALLWMQDERLAGDGP